ncbi:MAG TPA: DUF2155 domain-containing protein [Pseudorhodoplanes sp.]|nr:DUF2155 domain-containing protein [Pseudorhodoplanes sp.]
MRAKTKGVGPAARVIALGLAAAFAFADSAQAQFGTIFGEPPRPPADVPARRNPDFPPLDPPPTVQAPARGAPVQSQPLPPPGAPAVPLDTRPQQSAAPQASPTPGLPPGQRQPRGTPQPPGTQTASVPPPEEQPEPPTPKVPNGTAVFSGLDKITGRIISFDVAMDETVQFGALQVTPRVCYTRPPTELPLTDGFVEVSEVTLQGEVRRIFTGWMFAASPGLHAVEHPIYDVWLTDCKNPQTKIAEDPTPAQPAPTQRPQRPTGQQSPARGNAPQTRPQQPAQAAPAGAPRPPAQPR